MAEVVKGSETLSHLSGGGEKTIYRCRGGNHEGVPAGVAQKDREISTPIRRLKRGKAALR